MRIPLWQESYIRDEPLLFIEQAEIGLLASLQSEPTGPVVLKRFDGSLLAPPLRVRGREVLAPPVAPRLAESSLFPGSPSDRAYGWHHDMSGYIHFSEGDYFLQKQVLASYQTIEKWNGPIPVRQGDLLPGAVERLRQRGSLTIGLLGDSIAAGANASEFVGVSPYQPSFGGLLRDMLQEKHGGIVNLVNRSVGGKTAAWGCEEVKGLVESSPDLVLVAFGMNDGSALVEPSEFATNIHRIITELRAFLPTVEIILISGAGANPDWHLAEIPRRSRYRHELLKMRGAGTAVCDVTEIWDFLVERKGFWSLTANGINHPNDYGHRLYANCLLETMAEPLNPDPRNGP